MNGELVAVDYVYPYDCVSVFGDIVLISGLAIG